MAKPWSKVEASEAYKKLSPQNRVNAKIQYWQEVISVKSQFQELSPQNKTSARNQFFAKERNFTPPIIPEGSLRKGYREYGAPLAHALSTLALGIPRLAARATGAEEIVYPEQETGVGKALRIGAEVPAFALGGIGRVAAKAGARVVPRLGVVAGKEILRRKALRAGLEGLTAGALTMPKKGYLSPAERAGTALSYGAVSAGLPFLGAGIGKVGQAGKFLGRTITRDIGMMSNTSMNTIKRLGFNKVKAVAQQGGEFLTNTIIPQAKKKIVEGITKLGRKSIDFLDDIGFKPNEIDDILRVSKDNLIAFGDMVSDNAAVLLKNIDARRELLGRQLGKLRNVSEKNGVRVDIRFPLQIMRRELKKYGFIEYTLGNRGRSLKMPSGTISGLENIYNDFKDLKTLSMSEFKNFIERVGGAIRPALTKEGEKFNISAYTIRNALTKAEDIALSPIAYLRNAGFPKLKKDYSDMSTLYALGTKLDKVINVQTEGIESAFSKLHNYFYDPSRKKFLGIYGKELLDNIDLLSAARDLYPEAVRGGLLRTAGQELVKGGYALREGLRNITSPIGRMLQPIGQPISRATTGGYPIRQLSLVEALRQISNSQEQ